MRDMGILCGQGKKDQGTSPRRGGALALASGQLSNTRRRLQSEEAADAGLCGVPGYVLQQQGTSGKAKAASVCHRERACSPAATPVCLSGPEAV